jgi:hypothetical protein
MSGKELKRLLKAAGTKINKLWNKVGLVKWADLSDTERAAWMGWLFYRLENDRDLGTGKLVNCGGIPTIWWDEDTRIHGYCKYPDWIG